MLLDGAGQRWPLVASDTSTAPYPPGCLQGVWADSCTWVPDFGQKSGAGHGGGPGQGWQQVRGAAERVCVVPPGRYTALHGARELHVPPFGEMAGFGNFMKWVETRRRCCVEWL